MGAAHDLSSVRMVLSGAAPMGKDLEDAFMAKLPGAVLGHLKRCGPNGKHLVSLVLGAIRSKELRIRAIFVFNPRP